MSKRGGKRRRRSARGGLPGWLHSLLWFVVGLALGLAVLLPLLFWGGGEGTDTPDKPSRPAQPQSAPEPTPPEPAPAPAEPTEPAEEPAARAPEPPEQDAGEGDGGYRFYTLLPEMEVEVPEPEPEEPAAPKAEPGAEPAPGPAAPQDGLPEASEAGRFLVQVAAFRQRKPAEKLKARLALRGLQSRVVSADLGDKGTWHRVRLGPYPGRADAERVRDRLESDGMQGMILRK
jgi:septal ring-binding cell division protein DamX